MTRREKDLQIETKRWFKKFNEHQRMRPKTSSGKIRQAALFNWLMGEGLAGVGAAYIDVEREKRDKRDKRAK